MFDLDAIRTQEWFDFIASAAWIFLVGIGWLSQLGGWILIATGGYHLLRDPQRGQSPYKQTLMCLFGGVALLQAEALFRMLGNWLLDNPVAGEMGDLDAWFRFGEAPTNEVRDQLKDILFNLASVSGYTIFVMGLYRTARTGQPDRRGQPILLSSGISSIFGGLLLVYLPWLVTRLWN